MSKGCEEDAEASVVGGEFRLVGFELGNEILRRDFSGPSIFRHSKEGRADRRKDDDSDLFLTDPYGSAKFERPLRRIGIRGNAKFHLVNVTSQRKEEGARFGIARDVLQRARASDEEEKGEDSAEGAHFWILALTAEVEKALPRWIGGGL